MWVTCRYRTVQSGDPASECSTSSAACAMTLRCGSAHSKWRVSRPSVESVSATGSHPNGAKAARGQRLGGEGQRGRHGPGVYGRPVGGPAPTRPAPLASGLYAARAWTCAPSKTSSRSPSTTAPSPCGGWSTPARCSTSPTAGYLELVSEFEVAGGGEVDPHSHPTHEFYYVTSGRGLMRIERRGARDRPGRPRAHPAERRPQPPTGQRPCAHPLLLLRGRPEGRRRGRLHDALIGVARVVVTRRLPDGGLDPLARRRPRRRSTNDADEPHTRRVELRAAAADADAIVCLLTDRIDADVLAAGRRAAARRRERRCRLRQHRPRRGRRSGRGGVQHAGGARRDHRRPRVPADPGRLPPRRRRRRPTCASGALAVGWGILQYLGHDVHGATLGPRRVRPHRPGGRPTGERLRDAAAAPRPPDTGKPGYVGRPRPLLAEPATSCRCTSRSRPTPTICSTPAGSPCCDPRPCS